MIDKETQPPSRISQGRLVEMMEERGLGTKATRADIIQKLYDRGYVFDNPPEPSETGIAMYKAFHEYVPRMATPEMTAELEQDMDQIAAGETSKDEVLRISREMLHSTTSDLQDRREELAKQIWAGMDEDKFLGPCKVCEEAGRSHDDGSPNRLRIIELKGGKRMYGCEGWDPRQPRVAGLLPGQRPTPRARLRALAARGALLDLRRDAQAHGQGLSRPSLEALPQRRLPVDGGDAARSERSGSAPGGEGGRGEWGLGRRRRGTRRPIPTRTEGQRSAGAAPSRRPDDPNQASPFQHTR